MAIWHLSLIFFSSLGTAMNFAIFIATCYIIYRAISYKRWDINSLFYFYYLKLIIPRIVVKVVTTVESFSYFKVEKDKYHYSPTVSPRDSSSLHWSPSIRKTQTRLPNTRIFFSSSHYHSCHWPTISFNTVPNIIIQI